MKQMPLVLSLVIVLSACGAPAAVQTQPPTLMPVPTSTEKIPAPVPTETVPAAPTLTEAMPAMKLPAPSFDSRTYINEQFGFAIDYPIGWTVEAGPLEHSILAKFMSSADLAKMDDLPAGETRVFVEASPHMPWNDLEHSIDVYRKTWSSSPGYKILEEEQLVLEQGLPAVQFTVQMPDKIMVFLFTDFKDAALKLSGEGDLDLVKEIVQRVRPISVK